MKTDIELRADILAELQWDASIRDEDIAVAVKDGVITLAGTVDNYAQRHAAECAIERVKGRRASSMTCMSRFRARSRGRTPTSPMPPSTRSAGTSRCRRIASGSRYPTGG